jgi:hypothetical protein
LETGTSAAQEILKNSRPDQIIERWKVCRKAIFNWYHTNTTYLDNLIRQINGKTTPLGSEEEYENSIHDYMDKEPDQTRNCPLDEPPVQAAEPKTNDAADDLFSQALNKSPGELQAEVQAVAPQATQPSGGDISGSDGLGTVLGILGAVAGAHLHMPTPGYAAAAGVGGIGCAGGQAAGTTVTRGNNTIICPSLR